MDYQLDNGQTVAGDRHRQNSVKSQIVSLAAQIG